MTKPYQISHFTYAHPIVHEWMANGLDHVERFIGHPTLPPEKRDTVKQHTEAVANEGYKIIQKVGYAFSQPLDDLALRFTNKVRVHDWGEIIAEPMTASGEMDPSLQSALARYSPIDTEARIALHFAKMGFIWAETSRGEAEFTSYLTYARETTIPATHAKGNMSAEDILLFYQNIDSLINETETNYKTDPKWNSPEMQEFLATVSEDYYDIEHKRVFEGTFGKTIEKWQGTHHASNMLQNCEKKLSAQHQSRIFSRYEGCFHLLVTQAA